MVLLTKVPRSECDEAKAVVDFQSLDANDGIDLHS